MKHSTITEEFLHLVLLHLEIELRGKLSDKIASHIDSLELIETVVLCEKYFNIKISDEAIERLVTFDDLINLIHDAKAIAI